MASVRSIVQELRTFPDCVVHPPRGLPLGIRHGDVLAADLAEFYEACGGAELFVRADYGLTLVPPDEFVPVNPLVIGEEVPEDITSHWYVFGRTAEREYISVDSHPSRLGRCYDSSHENHGVAGSCDIVAASVGQLLEELLRTRGGHWYWLRPGWHALGDAYDTASTGARRVGGSSSGRERHEEGDAGDGEHDPGNSHGDTTGGGHDREHRER